MDGHDLNLGGEIEIYRLIGRLASGDTRLPTVEDLSALDIAALRRLIRVIRQALRSDLSEQVKATLRRFIRERLDKAVAIVFAKTVEQRAKAVFRARLEAFADLFKAEEGGGSDLSIAAARAVFEAKAEVLGTGHADMIRKQVAFAVAQTELTPAQILMIIQAITTVEIAVSRAAAEAYFDTYVAVLIEEDAEFTDENALTKASGFSGFKTWFGPGFLAGDFSLRRTAIILMHELVHVEQVGQKTQGQPQQMLEGRAYGIDWQLALRLADAERAKATQTFMEGGKNTAVEDMADFCMTCVATHLLNLFRSGRTMFELPSALHLGDEDAEALYVEMITKVPKDYSQPLKAFLYELSQKYRRGVFGKSPWITRIPQLAAYCQSKGLASTMFHAIEDGTFGAPPSWEE